MDIVFTDLDGTLLDHETYSWEPARPALHALRVIGIPLVLASSKTAAELEPLRRELGYEWCPAIVENGAGILAAGEAPDGDTTDYNVILDTLKKLEPAMRARFSGFSDMGIDGIVNATGLSRKEARLAAKRCHSEPGLFSGTAKEEAAFVAALANAGIAARRGGRFLTLSLGGTKAGRMAEIAKTLCGPKAHTIALGDAPNDIEMLEAASRAFIVANPHGTPLPVLAGEKTGAITRTQKPGPAGWNEAILSLV